MRDVILYSTGCPRCNVLKQKMDSKGIDYTESNDIDKMLSMGITQVPVLVVGGERMEFTEANSWINEQESA